MAKTISHEGKNSRQLWLGSGFTNLFTCRLKGIDEIARRVQTPRMHRSRCATIAAGTAVNQESWVDQCVKLSSRATLDYIF